MFASDFVDTPSLLTTLGVPGLVFVVLVLAGVVIYLFKALQKAQTKLDDIQEQRVIDAKETRDKLTEPLAQQARMSEQIYDFLINRRGQ